jgi:hypothetical protein
MNTSLIYLILFPNIPKDLANQMIYVIIVPLKLFSKPEIGM